MDGYDKDDVPQTRIMKVPTREKKGKPIGKKFFDKGDYLPGERQRTSFVGGEFTVLCYQPGSGTNSPSYWCERDTGVGSGTVVTKRHIEEFDVNYVHKLIDKYDNE